MNASTAATVIGAELDAGAEFVDIYEEETRNASVSLRDRKIENATAASHRRDNLRLPALAHAPGIQEVVRSREAAGQVAKLPFLLRTDQAGYAASPAVAQVSASLSDARRRITIANSEGLFISDENTRVRFTVSVTAEKDGERFASSESPGALRGFEFFEELDIEKPTRSAAERSLRMLSAGYIDEKKMPIILGNGVRSVGSRSGTGFKNLVVVLIGGIAVAGR